jgi:hypothetical protein
VGLEHRAAAREEALLVRAQRAQRVELLMRVVERARGCGGELAVPAGRVGVAVDARPARRGGGRSAAARA